MDDDNKLRAEYARFDGLSAEDVVKEFGRFKAKKEEQEEALKQTNAIYDFLRLVKIPQLFEDRDITMLKVAGVGRCQLAGDLHAAIVTGQKEKAFSYLRDTGRGDLIQESVNASTLKATIKEAIKAGEELPADLFRVSPFTRASLVKG